MADDCEDSSKQCNTNGHNSVFSKQDNDTSDINKLCKDSRNDSSRNHEKSPTKSDKSFGQGIRFQPSKSPHSGSSSSNSPSSDSSSSSSSSDITFPPPPDGGWGWVVVFASFLIHFIADGYAFSFGVLYTELLEYFKESKGKTAWIGSLFVSVPLLTGPIASALTNKYGCRKITIIGSLLASTGFILSSFSNSTDMLCLTFGVISGFGLSMVYVPAVVIVAFYFEKKRAFATGIAVAGSGIGNCVFAPLIEILIQMYTWRGAVLLLGAIMLQMVVCGCLFRPLVPPSLVKERKRSRHLSHRSSRSAVSSFRQSIDDISRVYSLVSTIGTKRVRQSQSDDLNLVTHSLIQFPTYVSSRTSYVTPDLLHDLKKNGKSLHEYLAEHDLLDKFYTAHSLTNCHEGVEVEREEGPCGIEGVDEGDDEDPETVFLVNHGAQTTVQTNTLQTSSSLQGNSQHRSSQESDISMQNLHGRINQNLFDNHINTKLDDTPIDTVSSVISDAQHDTAEAKDKNHSISSIVYLTDKSLPLATDANIDKSHVTIEKPIGHSSKNGVISPMSPQESILHQSRPRFKKTEVQGQFLQPLSRKDIFYRGNLLKPGAFFSGRAVSCPDVFIHQDTGSDEDKDCLDRLKLIHLSKEVKHIITMMLDMSILRSAVFNYFCLSSMLLYMAYDVPYVYTVDKAISEMEIPERKASFLLSIIGLLSTVGQVVIGYIGDQPRVDTLQLYNALTSIAGLCTMLVPVLTSYAWLSVYCASYGFFISANYALTTIILVDLCGMERLTNAYGIVMLAEGIANVIGPPLAGWLSDLSGSYDSPFIAAGAIMLFSGLMLFAIPCLRRCDAPPPESHSTSSSASAISQDRQIFQSDPYLNTHHAGDFV